MVPKWMSLPESMLTQNIGSLSLPTAALTGSSLGTCVSRGTPALLSAQDWYAEKIAAERIIQAKHNLQAVLL